MFILNGGRNGGGIPGGPMPIGAVAMKPGGMDPGVKPIWDDGGNAGGGIIGGATRVLIGTPAFGESCHGKSVRIKTRELNATPLRPLTIVSSTISNGSLRQLHQVDGVQSNRHRTHSKRNYNQANNNRNSTPSLLNATNFEL